MKSLARQSADELGGSGSVLSRQKRDHVKLDQLLDRLSEEPAGEQDALLRSIYRLVFPHAFAEEAVLWPVIRRVLPDGQELTLRVELEHQEINELVTRLESLAPESPERQMIVSRIIGLLRQDVRDEEDELLPRLQTNLNGSQLRRLGFAWEAVRRVAPTRAHPLVSRRPPGNVLAALPLSILDRLRDGVDALIHRGAGSVERPLSALGSALARASHAVERLPGMKHGEDSATRIGRNPRFGWGTLAIATAAASATIMVARRR